MTSPAAPACPLCGAPMRYIAAQGRWRGDFWGCIQYPKTGCPGKINVSSLASASPEAGASAQEKFERERARHLTWMRATFPLLAIGTLMVMTTAFFTVAPFNAIAASAISLAAGVLCLFVITRLPRQALYWERGARGEQKTAQYLAPLTERGFVILHDRKVPGSRANIDHIAIGPSGVFVIESKHLSGPIEVLNDRLYVGDRDRHAYVEELYRESLATQMALRDSLNRMRLTVTPVLCIHGARTPRFDHVVDGVRLLAGSELKKLAESPAQVLTPDQIRELASLADRSLRGMFSWER